MENFSEHIVAYGVWTVVVIVFIFLLRAANIFRYIPNNQVGIVEKLWATKGSIKTASSRLHGEAGFEPEMLRGGMHVFFPFTYRIHKSDLVTVGQGKIAYVFARDGAPLGASQVLAANDTEDKSDFQDVRRFLLDGGQKGPQRKILREGTYAINTAQFAIITDERVYGHALSAQEQRRARRHEADDRRALTASRRWCSPPTDDLVGIVTVHDGPSLPPGEIIAPEVGTDLRRRGDLSQQFPGAGESSCEAGGYRGRQLQVHASKAPGTSTGCSRPSSAVPKTVIPGRQCRRRDLLHRSAGPPTCRASSIATANSW